MEQRTLRLSDLTAAAIVDAVYANWIEFYVRLGHAPGVELSVDPPLAWTLTGIPDSFLNVVFRTAVPPDQAARVVDETLEHLADRGIAQLSWLRPGRAVARCLVERGFEVDRVGTAMAGDLADLPDEVRTPAGLEIVEVRDRTELVPWVEVMCTGFETPASAMPRVVDVFEAIGREPQVRTYLARSAGRPVATSQLFLGAGVAGIYNVTCLAETRGQGIGTAITVAALLEARRLGYRMSVLQASSLGKPVYRRLGLGDHGLLDRYLLVAPSG